MLSNELLIYSWLAGITVFIGGAIAWLFEKQVHEGLFKDYVIHSFLAFGSGTLLSAMALVLLPRSMETLNVFKVVLGFSAGVFIFRTLNSFFEKKGGKIGTLLAMLMDFIPEAIALGALFSIEPRVAILLAIFIGLQNAPEAFNSYRDLVSSGLKPKLILFIFFLLSFVGVLSAVSGHMFLTDKPEFTALLMIFASGGILYLLFDDLIPAMKMAKSTLPAIMASLGFLVGMIGEKVI